MLNRSDAEGEFLAVPRFDSVLVIEDDGLVAMLMEELARDQGAKRLHISRDPAEALRIAQVEQLDCAILDVAIWRGATSFEIADTLAARGVPFLFCTGLTASDIAPRFRRQPLLEKPFTEDQFRAAIQQTLTL